MKIQSNWLGRCVDYCPFWHLQGVFLDLLKDSTWLYQQFKKKVQDLCCKQDSVHS